MVFPTLFENVNGIHFLYNSIVSWKYGMIYIFERMTEIRNTPNWTLSLSKLDQNSGVQWWSFWRQLFTQTLFLNTTVILKLLNLIKLD